MKKIITKFSALLMVLALVGCSASTEATKTSTGNDETKAEEVESTEETVTETYESIYNDYAAQLQEASPKLVEEYNSECTDFDLTGKAELSNKKIEELAKISTEGTEKMATLMYKNGDEYSVYEDWATKLTNVYMDEAQKITDAYMDSAV